MATSCKACPMGSFNALTGLQGEDVYQSCPAWTFSKATSATSVTACEPCPKGTSSINGSINCVACKAGEFIDTFGNVPINRESRCSECRFRNEVSDKPNSLECRACPVPSFPNEDSSGCRDCPPGFGSDREEFPFTCSRCRFGLFGDGSGSYRACKDGFEPDRELGATTCDPRPAGTSAGISSSFVRRARRETTRMFPRLHSVYRPTLRALTDTFQRQGILQDVQQR